MRISLVIVFNHAFESNLPRLDALYAKRFSDIHYLMPFYRGNRSDVSPTTHSSYNFQGFFAEAFRAIIAPNSDYYLFIGDDLILHPDVNEKTLPDLLGVDANTGYIKGLTPLEMTGCDWTHALAALRTLEKNRFVEFDAHLPCRDAATKHLLSSGRMVPDRSAWKLWRRLFYSWRRDARYIFLNNLLYVLRRDPSPLRLPLLASYSDFVGVPAVAMNKFCSMCGVFAALGMFVEVAIPTALALSCDHVHTEADIARRGREIWSKDESNAVLIEHKYSLRSLLDAMSPDLLYLHPIKLSRLHSF